MDTQSSILDLFCWHSVNWFRHCDYFKDQARLIAALPGTMIFVWFIILHVPRVIASPFADIGDEVTSAFLALAYSGMLLSWPGLSKDSLKKVSSST